MMKNIKSLAIYGAICLGILLGCKEEEVGPVLRDSSTFTAPVIKNPATSAAKVITPENAGELFEEFQWERTQYGMSLSTDYALEISKDEDFNNPRVLATTSADKASITNGRLNDAILSLGLPGFEESTVFIRVRSKINGISSDTLYSNIISRTATTYQDSECGKFCTVGIIGSATPGDWGTDTDMVLQDPERVDKSTWTTTLYLTGGNEVKFRANDDWDDNWGGSGFPSGTGEPGGPNIPIPTSGYYKVVFNDETGDYSFTLLSAPTFSTIGVIGDATPGGWGADTDLAQDSNNPHIWTGTVTLGEGEIKFRANDDWADNWGATTFPSGFGTGGGPNIPVKAGTYFVYFNDVTGEYALMPEANKQPYNALGIIGDATPGNWDNDTDLIQNPDNPYRWSKIVTLTEGEAKFRADDSWDVNWGGSDFPGGIGTQGGPNIPVKEGTYFVTFHTGTGEYYFFK